MAATPRVVTAAPISRGNFLPIGLPQLDGLIGSLCGRIGMTRRPNVFQAIARNSNDIAATARHRQD